MTFRATCRPPAPHAGRRHVPHGSCGVVQPDGGATLRPENWALCCIQRASSHNANQCPVRKPCSASPARCHKEKPLPTISLLNMKGGVGKTTLAVNIAWHLCRYGRNRVLLVDLDPQFNASQYIMHPETWERHRTNPGTVADLILQPHRPRMTARKKKRPPDNLSSGSSTSSRRTLGPVHA